MKLPRGLSASEAALWRAVADTVTPLDPPPVGEVAARSADGGGTPLPRAVADVRKPSCPLRQPLRLPPPPKGEDRSPSSLSRRTLDGTWDRRLAQGLVSPDAQIDLHGLGIDTAYTRLMASLSQAHLTGARVLLVIAGKSRPHGDHDQRGNRRGAIRAKLLDWLAASSHAARIAAIRPAHQRHGGAGAVYVVLRKAPRTSL